MGEKSSQGRYDRVGNSLQYLCHLLAHRYRNVKRKAATEISATAMLIYFSASWPRNCFIQKLKESIREIIDTVIHTKQKSIRYLAVKSKPAQNMSGRYHKSIHVFNFFLCCQLSIKRGNLPQCTKHSLSRSLQCGRPKSERDHQDCALACPPFLNFMGSYKKTG